MKVLIIHTTTHDNTVITRMRLKMRGMIEPRKTKNRASAEGRGRTIMVRVRKKTRRRSLYACDRVMSAPI